MILVNFNNSLSELQNYQLQTLAGQDVTQVFLFRLVPESDVPISKQLSNLMKKITLTAEELEGQRLVVNLPSSSFQGALVIAALRGRFGFFPIVMRTRPMMYSVPPRTEIAELADLEELFNATQSQA